MTTTQARRTSRPDPWDRQPTDTDKSFDAFIVYRDMGAGRSTSKVARTLGKSKALIDRWCTAHSWVIRCHAYDSNVDREHLIEMRELRRKSAKRNMTAAALAMQKFGEVVMALDTNNGVKLADIAAVARVAVAMEEASLRTLGDPGARGGAAGTSGAVDEDTIAGMSDEERRARLSMLVREANERLEDTDSIHDGLHDNDDDDEE